jgi:hypothetical protein
MAEKRGISGTKNVGKPYTMDGVYATEIQPYVRDNADAGPDFFDLDKMFSLFIDEEGRWQYNLNSTFYLIDIPDEVCQWYICPTDMHWPSISWKVYGSTRLAWFLMKLNGVRDQNIFNQIKAGTRIRYLDYTQFVHEMLSNMEQEHLRQG